MKKFLSIFLILMLAFSLCNVSAENKDIAEVHVLLDQKGLFISADIGVLPQSTVLTATKIETAEGIQKLNTTLENIATAISLKLTDLKVEEIKEIIRLRDVLK